MRSTVTFDPRGKKSDYEAKAKSEGLRIGEWVRRACEVALVGEKPALSEYLAQEIDSANAARKGLPERWEQNNPDRRHKGEIVRCGVRFCDDDCWCKK